MSPVPKLSDTQRGQLIARRRAGEPIKVLAHEYGVSTGTVTRICGVRFPKMSAARRTRNEHQEMPHIPGEP